MTLTQHPQAEEHLPPDDDKVLVKSDLDRTYEELRATSPSEEAGLFGPGSMMWQALEPLPVLPFMLIQAGLLEAPAPKIWFGTENSITRSGDFASRYARSFDAFSDWFNGDVERALRTGRRIHGYHSRITGHAPKSIGHVKKGQEYSATEQKLMIFTWGTQIEPIKRFYDMLVRPMTADEAERYYDDCKRFAKIFGIDTNELPQTWPAFEAYWNGVLTSGEMEMPKDEGFDRFGPLYDQSELGFRAKWIVRWIMSVQFNLLPDNIRVMYLPITPLAKKRTVLTKVSCFGFKYLMKAMPTTLNSSLRVRKAQRRAGALGEPGRLETKFMNFMPHPFGEKMPSLNTPASADADPTNSKAFSIPSR